jgi:hypothetical protein
MGTRLDKISVSVWSRAAPIWSRAAGRVRSAAYRVAVKEIRSGSSPSRAAARAMMVRAAW